ncbi:ABC transporter substrate-binding protein [Thalassococcus sp. CAU 1522]|uniref:ABC transporter substrate-binding protein n=1 Tax=Thalassococcus arenae TaxID=2851652 RepID=A0ABS6ND86_9RHOB|nr:ABC transporter substrate-binding protein [Thalassococcus arenae]MBV2361569.1 ABC transporter substrate-binding protein [Thalassococcus arenae]
MITRLAALLIALSAPVARAEPEAVSRYGDDAAARSLLVRGTTDIALFDQLLDRFAARFPDTRITYEQWGSNDLYAVTAAECETGGPAADAVISSAVDLQVKLVNDGCARSHRSPLTAALPDTLNWRDELFGITREPAVLVYKRDMVPANEAPRSRFDLIDLLRPEDSRYAGRVATYDIEQSGLGYLFAFLDSQQATTFGSLIEAFDRAGAVATCCSAEIIDGVVSGRYLIAYNVLGSYALARAAEVPDLVVVAPEDYTLVLARAALIPRGARDPESAGQFVDFMLGEDGRRAMAAERLIIDFTDPDPDTGSFYYPSGNQSAFRQIPLSPVLLVGLDRQKRALFLERWRETFTRY